MKRLSVLIVVLGMSQTAFAAPPGAVKKKFAPEDLSQREAGLWQTAPHDPSTIRALADWFTDGNYALGEIFELLVYMQNLADSVDRIEYLRGESLTKFLDAQRQVRLLVRQHQQKLQEMMTIPPVVGVYTATGWTYFALSDLHINSLRDFVHLANLQGRRHLVHRLTVNGRIFFTKEAFNRAFNHADYRDVMKNITELRLLMFDQRDLSEALLGFLAKNPKLLPRLRVLHLVGVPRGFSLGGFGTSTLGQQLHTLTLEAGTARYHFNSLVKEVGRPGSFKSLTGLHLLPRQRGEPVDAQVNVTAAGLKQLRSASFRLTHLTLPRITTGNKAGNKASIPANLFGTPCLGGLEELTMDVTGTDPGALIEALDGLKQLKVWDISKSEVTPDFWNAVVGSQAYQRLLSLIAQSTSMSDRAAEILAKHPSKSLRFLDVSQNPDIGKNGHAALANAAFPDLRTLGVGYSYNRRHADNPLTPDEFRQILLERNGLPNLQMIIRHGLEGGFKELEAVSHSGQSIVFRDNVTQLIELPASIVHDRGSVTIHDNCPATFRKAG